MPKKARKPRLLTDRIAPSLEEKCAAYLAKGLPPDADEFDRVCFERWPDLWKWLSHPSLSHKPPFVGETKPTPGTAPRFRLGPEFSTEKFPPEY